MPIIEISRRAERPVQSPRDHGFAMILPCMDGIAKYLSTFQAMSPGQVRFYRFFFQLVLTVPLLLRGLALRAF